MPILLGPMLADQNPLTAAVPEEILLPNAPLLRVVARVNFPVIVSIAKAEFIAPFQEALRPTYPVLRPDQTLNLVLSGVPVVAAPAPQTTWRFSDASDKWRVSLATNFMAIETTAYVSRSDFIERLRVVASALTEHVNPQVADRVGLRYIDRITGDALKNLGKYVRPEVMGILATPAATQVRHSMSESLFTLPQDKRRFQVRWGQIPPNATVDPAAIDPIGEPSWILDLDMFCAGSRPFEAKVLVDEVGEYADRIYTFFRWAVTDEFLKLYGGQI